MVMKWYKLVRTLLQSVNGSILPILKSPTVSKRIGQITQDTKIEASTF